MSISHQHRLLLLMGFGLLLYGCARNSADQAKQESVRATAYSYRCEGEAKVIVVTISGNRGQLFSAQASQPIQREPGAQGFKGDEVFYLPGQPPDLAPGQTAEITIQGRKLKNCKNNPRAAVWEAAKLRGVSYRAIGQEPAWQMEISTDNGFLLITDYGENKLQFPYAEPDVNQAQRTTRYTSNLDDDGIVITIKGQECRDSMSGEAFSSQVEVVWQDQTLVGCGRALH